MKRLLILFFALAVASGHAQSLERILAFQSDITIHEDTSLTVTETIRVAARGNQIKRGIFRDFPRLYKGSLGLRRERGFEILRVLRNGSPENYDIEPIGGGTRIRIGQAHVLLEPGEHTYSITYRTTRQLGYFTDHDELYWNVTGNGWAFPIDKASAKVVLPRGLGPIEASAYTGIAGSNGQDFSSTTLSDGTVLFETTRPLGQAEGLTIVVTFAKGALDYGADPQGLGPMLQENPGASISLLGLIALFLYFYLAWARVGKDPEAGTIIPLYEPPHGFSPAAVRNLYRMSYDDKTFSAAVIGLAAKGLITIEEQKGEYSLRKTGKTAILTADESALYDKLMAGSGPLKLTQKNHKQIGAGKEALKKSLSLKLEKTHFVKNLGYWAVGLLFAIIPMLLAVVIQAPEGLFMVLWLSIWSVGTMFLVSAAITSWLTGQNRIGTTLFALPFLGAWLFGVGMFVSLVSLIIALPFALSFILVAVFYHLLKAPTHMGRQVLDQIEGFRQYLGVAEAERLNLENPPQRTPELFEKFLPYALALNVDQQWSEQFSDILTAAGQSSGEGKGPSYQPSFYTGSAGMGRLTAGALTSAIAGSLTTALASSSVSPSSSSGGGGGGSSGGGGGGGGGGGW